MDAVSPRCVKDSDCLIASCYQKEYQKDFHCRHMSDCVAYTLVAGSTELGHPRRLRPRFLTRWSELRRTKVPLLERSQLGGC